MPKFEDQKRLIWVFLTKNSLFGYFGTRDLKKLLSNLKSAHYFQNFTKKQKCLNLGPKMPDLFIFGLELENNIVIFEISTFEFV